MQYLIATFKKKTESDTFHIVMNTMFGAFIITLVAIILLGLWLSSGHIVNEVFL